MNTRHYIQGWLAAVTKLGMAAHDIEYMRRFSGAIQKDPKSSSNTSKAWDLFNTKEGPGSSAGFGEESSNGIM